MSVLLIFSVRRRAYRCRVLLMSRASDVEWDCRCFGGNDGSSLRGWSGCGCKKPPGRAAHCRRWYCDTCWKTWLDENRKAFLDQPIRPPARYRGRAVRDFGDQNVHVMQIGLGTYGTFLRPDARWLQVLLKASTRRSSEALRGIGVDPVEESVGPLESLALRKSTRLNASVVHGAVVESTTQSKISVFCLPRNARLELRRKMEQRKVEMCHRIDVDKHLAYLENMSAVGGPHPDFEFNAARVQQLAGVRDSLLEERSVSCYTFEKVLKMHSAKGCEVLIIDAEGADCAILRSMVGCCRARRCPWPRVIRFETRGFACTEEELKGGNGCEEEEETIRILQQEGYLLVEEGGDATLLHGPSLRTSEALAEWADHHFLLSCYVCKWQLWPSKPSFAKEVGEGCSQWRGTLEDRKIWLRQGLGNRWLHQSDWCCRECLTSGGIRGGQQRSTTCCHLRRGP